MTDSSATIASIDSTRQSCRVMVPACHGARGTDGASQRARRRKEAGEPGNEPVWMQGRHSARPTASTTGQGHRGELDTRHHPRIYATRRRQARAAAWLTQRPRGTFAGTLHTRAHLWIEFHEPDIVRVGASHKHVGPPIAGLCMGCRKSTVRRTVSSRGTQRNAHTTPHRSAAPDTPVLAAEQARRARPLLGGGQCHSRWAAAVGRHDDWHMHHTTLPKASEVTHVHLLLQRIIHGRNRRLHLVVKRRQKLFRVVQKLRGRAVRCAAPI